jgi:hypothetical protein
MLQCFRQIEKISEKRPLSKMRAANCSSVLGRALPREHPTTDQALPHALTEGDEHFANLVGIGGTRLSSSALISGHVDQQ